MASVDDGLQRLDSAITAAEENEQVRRAYEWYSTLEKSNPTAAGILLKTYLESLGPVKWVTALLQPSVSAGGEHGRGAAHSRPSGTAASVVEPLAGEEYERLLKIMCEAAPELRDYHVILVPKEGGPSVEQFATSRE